MDFASLVFYALAALTLFSGVMVITARNPVHSVLFLIFAFFNAAGLFILLGAEYVAMTLVIVYVGAVAVLFLFVVMMLNITATEIKQGFQRYLPLGLVLVIALLVMAYQVVQASAQKLSGSVVLAAADPVPDSKEITNTQALGQLIYTDYALVFQLAGLILLVAMIGAIVLTLRHRPDARRQNISQQVARKREDGVALVKVASGKGTAEGLE